MKLKDFLSTKIHSIDGKPFIYRICIFDDVFDLPSNFPIEFISDEIYIENITVCFPVMSLYCNF